MMDSPPEAKKLKLDDLDIKVSTDALDSKSGGNDTDSSVACHNSKLNRPVQEIDVGITEFISTLEGFHGIIKQRYSDFLVNEIDVNGKKVSLTSLDNIDAPISDHVQKTDSIVATEELSEKVLQEIQDLTESNMADAQVTIEVGEDKVARTKIHRFIAENFPQFSTHTQSVKDTKYIIVSRTKGGSGRGSNKGGRSGNRQNPWLHKGKDYCRCVLYKENMDTMFAVNIITKYLRIKTNMVTYSGTKDKRAKTCQNLSFYRVTASRLCALNVKLRDIVLGNFRYCSESLGLGDLKGNHFVIILRSVTGSDHQISEAVTSLQQNGFINYYGMQRFGTTSVPTHLVGGALLRSNWEEAIDLIMKPRTASRSDQLLDVRECWWLERDAGKAIEIMGRRTGPERHLLEGLRTKNPNDYVGALGCMPRNNRLMYVHAYQSYLWNRLVSHRIQVYGLKPILGDLVITANGLVNEVAEETEPSGDEDRLKREFQEPTLITEDNIGEFTIYDVVLPQVGYDVTYPNNAVGELYNSWLKEDGLTASNLKHKVKDYALRGSYRRIVLLPKDLAWEIIRYDDPNISLVLSDLEQFQEQKLSVQDTGSSKALKLEFTLPSSTYATMALREILKQDTSAAHQTTLTATVMANKQSSATGTSPATENS